MSIHFVKTIDKLKLGTDVFFINQYEDSDYRYIAVIKRGEGYTSLCSLSKYSKFDESIEPTMLNWKNTLYCSNCYDIATDVEYIYTAVQEKKKPAASLSISPAKRELLLRSINKREITLDQDCNIYWNTNLDELLNFRKVKEVYSIFEKQLIEEKGITIFWNELEEFFKMPISELISFNSINTQHHWYNNGILLFGLLFGYSIESTVSYLCEEKLAGFDYLANPAKKAEIKEKIQWSEIEELAKA